MELVQYNECYFSSVDIDGLVFSTRTSVATVLNEHPCVSSCLWVNPLRHKLFWGNTRVFGQPKPCLTYPLWGNLAVIGEFSSPRISDVDTNAFNQTLLWLTYGVYKYMLCYVCFFSKCYHDTHSIHEIPMTEILPTVADIYYVCRSNCIQHPTPRVLLQLYLLWY